MTSQLNILFEKIPQIRKQLPANPKGENDANLILLSKKLFKLDKSVRNEQTVLNLILKIFGNDFNPHISMYYNDTEKLAMTELKELIETQPIDIELSKIEFEKFISFDKNLSKILSNQVFPGIEVYFEVNHYDSTAIKISTKLKFSEQKDLSFFLHLSDKFETVNYFNTPTNIKELYALRESIKDSFNKSNQGVLAKIRLVKDSIFKDIEKKSGYSKEFIMKLAYTY